MRDQDTRADTVAEDDAGRGTDGEPRRLKPTQAARSAAEQLAELRGKPVDGIAGLERLSDGWRVVVDLLEVPRVPPTTDVLGSYEVTLDGDGDLVQYERLQRYVRAQAGEQE